jgi:hybrid polyketide synthase/nonribosomal peptide synthetase ACE1
MIHVMAIPLELLPLSNHSKVDRRAIGELPLPERSFKSSDDDGVEMTEAMSHLNRLWNNVLGHEELGFVISPSTSFFEVGSNSLLWCDCSLAYAESLPR